jgi:hypothetical protein
VTLFIATSSKSAKADVSAMTILMVKGMIKITEMRAEEFRFDDWATKQS